ncbi:putative transposase subunit, partial [Cutibacterium acnes P06A]
APEPCMASGSSNAAKRWQQVEITALDPFRDYKHAIDDHLDNATAVLSPFHVVKLAAQALDEARRRVQQAPSGNRGRTSDPLYGIQTILRAGAENLSDKQKHRLATVIDANEAHEKMFITWHKQRNGSGPSTDRSNSTAASPVAPATATTTAYSAAHRRGQHTRTTAKSDEPFIAQQLFG